MTAKRREGIDRMVAAASHEAGHAVIAVHYRIRIDYVRIAAAGTGYVRAIRRAGPVKTMQGAKREWQLALAGACAEMQVAPREHVQRGVMSDMAEAVRIAFRTFGQLNPDEMRERTAAWNGEMAELVASYRPAIDAIAAVLLKRRRLSGRTVRRIVRAHPRLELPRLAQDHQ
jgi:ATP-dependent Zn protease